MQFCAILLHYFRCISVTIVSEKRILFSVVGSVGGLEGVKVWGDSKGFENTDTRLCPRPQGCKQITGGQLLVTKGMQPWELDKTTFNDNKESREQVSNII